jgi:hypothetical protein
MQHLNGSFCIVSFSLLWAYMVAYTYIMPTDTQETVIGGFLAWGQQECWWITPVILTTQEVEIKRISVQGQSGQIGLETLSQNYPTQKSASEGTQVVEHLPASIRPWVQTPILSPSKKIKQKGLGAYLNGGILA